MVSLLNWLCRLDVFVWLVNPNIGIRNKSEIRMFQIIKHTEEPVFRKTMQLIGLVINIGKGDFHVTDEC